MKDGEASAPRPLRVLVVGPDTARLAGVSERLRGRGIHCETASSSSPAALRGHLLDSPDAIVAIEVSGSWQPTRCLLDRDAAARGSRAGVVTAPILVLSDGAGVRERVEALSDESSNVWDWVEIDAPDEEIAARLARLARVRRMSAEIDDLSRRCAETETIDRITGLPNHRAFQEQLSREFRRAQRYGATLSLLIVDIDRFRFLNESHGHEFGDRILREAARGLRSLLREVDMAARFGGEEFAVLLPETDETAALAVAGRVRTMIGSLPELIGQPPGGGADAIRITASVGVASHPHEGTATRGLLLAAAESALRRAKDEGRNRALTFSATGRAATPARSPADTGGWSGGTMDR